MQDRPTVLELLAAVRGFLEEDIVPVLEGRKRFHALVSANVLAILERELGGEEAALLAEWVRLAQLLRAADERPPERLDALRAAVRTLNTDLAERIRRGEADAGPWAEAVRAHVRETVMGKLRVANPRFPSRQ